MRNKLIAFVLPAMLLALVAGCAEDQTPRSYVQANAVQKSLFTGEWYYRTCVIRTDYEAGDMAFPGDCSADWINYGGGVTIPRIRWMIDQNYLFAIRSYSYVEGADVENAPILGEPVLAFAIDSHFDIRRDYNPTTGEEVNVIVENDSDRHWAEREYVRVDWSQNLIMTMDVFTAQLYDAVQIYSREPAPFFVQEGTDSTGVQWPESYRPRFVRTSAAEDAHTGEDRVTEYGGEGELYYMDFVTQEIYTPGNVPDPYTGQSIPWCMSVYVDAPICTSSLITLRNSFLKVAPYRDYEPEEWTDSRFENGGGYWRMGRPTFDQSDDIDPTDPHFGMTDFWTYPVGRFNIWRRWHDEAGERIAPQDREIRKVYFYTTFDFPLHLLRPAVEIAAEWNRQYMRMARIVQKRALPSWDDGRWAPGETPDWEWIPDLYDPQGRAYTCADGPDVMGTCPMAERTYSADGYGCRITIDSRDTGFSVPTEVPEYMAFNSGVRTDADFTQDRYLAMEGDECVIVGRVNSCVRHPPGRDGPDDPGEPCEERGDLRYAFLSYVGDASTGWAGVAEMRSDPVTGEFVAGAANMGGPALDAYRTRVLLEWDLETGQMTEEEYYLGEQYRDYMGNLFNNVDRPPIPQREMPPIESTASSVMGVPLTAMRTSMEAAFARAEQLKGEIGRANIYSSRPRSLVGSEIERVLFDNDEALAAYDIAKVTPGMGTTENRLDLASPFRTPLAEQIRRIQHMEDRLNLGLVTRPAVWSDGSVTYFVDRVQTDYPGVMENKAQLSFLVDAALYRAIILHEFGHVLGLRHSFAGTADYKNYNPRYYQIDDDNPWPVETDYDLDGDGHLNDLERAAFGDAQEGVRQARDLAGIRFYMNAALMDYPGNWYEELVGLGSQDIATMYMGYGDVIEVWETDGTEPRPDRTGVRYWTYYHGGEACTTDADCPYGVGGDRYGELMSDQIDAGAVQSCAPWETSYGSVTACSNIRHDLARINPTGIEAGSFADRTYNICTDDNQSYEGDCSVFDEGGSYREIVANAREYWDRVYLRAAFRRYRRTFDYYPYMNYYTRFYMIAHKIFNELFYKWAANEGDYRDSTEPFGFYDHYLAAVDILNWYIQTLALPNVGSYQYNSWQNLYGYANRYLDMNDLNIPMGVGKHTYSLYQGGLDGINRLERMGVLYDKIWTMQLMLMRDWGYGWTRDEPYFVNMYDLFPAEINYLMTGLVADEPGFYMPRVISTGMDGEDTRIIYPTFWRGACRFDHSGETPCWSEDDSLSALIPLESSSFYVQMLGVIYGLSEIPTPFDPSFQEQAMVYIVGSAGGVRVPEDARECTTTESSEDCDFAIFTSDDYHRRYLAFRVEDDVRGVGGGSLGFAIIRKANEQKGQLHCLEQCLVDAGGEWGGSPTRYMPTPALCAQERCGVQSGQYVEALDNLRYLVDSYESFMRYLLELQSTYGLNSWIQYSGSLD